jgi:hypothetical protein
MINLKIFISLIVFLNCFLFAQQNTFNKDAEIQRFVERGGKVEETSSNVYKLIYPDGNSSIYNLNHKKSIVNNLDGVDTTIINIWEIDTTRYAHKFSFWQKVEVANSWWRPLPIADLNNNNQPELYGYTDFPNLPYPPGGPVRIFERDIDGIYKSIFEYDSSTFFVKGLGDIHRTGGKDIYMSSKLVNNGVVYRSDSVSLLPITFDFIFYYEPNQINDMIFGDFNDNNITDCAFVDASNPSSIIIGEYRDSINNFASVYEKITENETPTGFAIDDFDSDGKTELILATSERNIYAIENLDTNTYEVIWSTLFPIYNPYMQTITNDIDGNGKKEYWIGGQEFEEGISIFQCYEAVGDNSYSVVAYIEIRYLVSLNTAHLQAVDIDDDDTEELIISIGNSILILKFAGSTNEHIYKVFYAKFNEATQPGAEFYPVAIADLDGDAEKDILLPFRKYVYPVTYAFSYILKQNSTSDIQEYNVNADNSISLYSFPLPFNSSNTIRFSIKESSIVKLRVFSCLGKEIDLLLDKKLSPGEYNVTWDARDKCGNPLPSGMYLISLQAKNLVKTIKTIFLK